MNKFLKDAKSVVNEIDEKITKIDKEITDAIVEKLPDLSGRTEEEKLVYKNAQILED